MSRDDALSHEDLSHEDDVMHEDVSGDHVDSPRVGPESAHPEVIESDPNGNGPQRLSGGMGISSERVGVVPGAAGEATHGAVDTHPDLPEPSDPPPEQSAGGPEPHPANDLPPHPFDPETAHIHSHG